MKKKVGKLFGKSIVEGGAETSVTTNEILLQKTGNKIILGERKGNEGKTTPITASSPILKSSAYFVIFRKSGAHVPNEIKATIPLNENSQDYYLIETDINQDTDYALIVNTPFPDRYTLESIENIQEQPGNFTFLLCGIYTDSHYEENKDKWTSDDFSSEPIIVEGNPASMLEQPVIYRMALKASGGHMHNKGVEISTISEQGFAVKFLKDTSYIMQDITLSAGAGDSVPVKGGVIINIKNTNDD